MIEYIILVILLVIIILQARKIHDYKRQKDYWIKVDEENEKLRKKITVLTKT